MLRRLLWACLCAAALVGMASRGLAKPPDLPEDHHDTVKPQITEEGPNTVVPCAQPAVNQAPDGVSAAAQWSVPTPEPPSVYEMLRIQPTVLRRLSSCLLYTVHPLLGLVPTDDFLEEPGEYLELFREGPGENFVSFGDAGTGNDPPPPQSAEVHGSVILGVGVGIGGFTPTMSISVQVQQAQTGSLLFGVGVNSDAGLTGSIILNERDFDVTPPPEPMTCPWRGPQTTGRVIMLTDPVVTGDVIDNLEKLIEADCLLERARELGRKGHLCEALDCLEKVTQLCPGCRFEERVAEAMADLFAHMYCCPASEEPCEEQKKSADDQPSWWQRLLNVFHFCGDSDDPNRRMEQLLNQSEDLRQIENEDNRFDKTADPSNPSPKSQTRKEREIEDRLTKPVNFNFTDVPLRQVIDDLRAWCGINVVADIRALQDEGVSLDSPINIKLEQVSLKSALKLLLKQVGLTYVIKDEVLQITTERCGRGKLVTKTYQVADLLTSGFKAEADGNDHAKTLITLITSTVEPKSWSEMGGWATIDYFPLSMSLVVNATPDVQEQVEDLLGALRHLQAAMAEQKAAKAVQVNGLMKACHLAMSEGRHARAAELAREAFALDPERVLADPLVYKMHLLSVMQDEGLCCPCDHGCKGSNGGVCTCPAEQKKMARAAAHVRKALAKIGIDVKSGTATPYILTDEATGEEVQEPHAVCPAVAKPYRAVIQSPAEEPFRAGHAKDGSSVKEAATDKDCPTIEVEDVLEHLSSLLPGAVQLEVNTMGDQMRMLWQFPVGEHLYSLRYHRGQWSVSVRNLEKGD
jgi:hypothetical protein